LRSRDWSLVVFTTLAQLSVGIILWFTVSAFILNNASLLTETGLSFRNPILLALVCIGVATVVSFLHLGSPANAPNALNNLTNSWLSREILALNVYILGLCLVLLQGWVTGSAEHIAYILMPLCLIGVGLLWMMIRIYVIATIPAWNSWYTPLSFVSTALSLGLLTLLVFLLTGAAIIDEWNTRMLLLVLMLVLFTESAAGFLHQARLEKLDTGINDLSFDQGFFYKTFLVRMALLTIAFLIIFVVILDSSLLLEYGYSTWLYPLTGLIASQELLGRLLFYSSYFRAGV
jgi:anaerobic dimethyl sulfoxide reductase subunit C (anchor subunit)